MSQLHPQHPSLESYQNQQQRGGSSGNAGAASSPKKGPSGSFRHSPYACGNNLNTSGNLSPCGPQSPLLGATTPSSPLQHQNPHLSAYHHANSRGGYGAANHHQASAPSSMDDETGMYGGGFYDEGVPTSDPRFLGSPTHHHYGSQNSLSNGSFSRHPTATVGGARGGMAGRGGAGSGYSSNTASPPPAASGHYSPHQPTHSSSNHHHQHGNNNNNMGGGSMSSSMYNSFDHHQHHHHGNNNTNSGYQHTNSQNGSFSGAPDTFYGSSSHHPYHPHYPTSVLPPPPTVPTTIRVGNSTTIQPLPPHLQPASPILSSPSPADSQRGEVRNKIMRGGMSSSRGRGTTTTPSPSSPRPTSEEHNTTTAVAPSPYAAAPTPAAAATTAATQRHHHHQQPTHVQVGGSSVPIRELSVSGVFGTSLDAGQYSPNLEASGSHGDLHQLPSFPEAERVGASQGRTAGGVRSSNSVDQDYYSENTSTTATGKSTGSKRKLRRGTRGGNASNMSATDSTPLPVARGASQDLSDLAPPACGVEKATPGGQISSDKLRLCSAAATPNINNHHPSDDAVSTSYALTPNGAHSTNNNNIQFQSRLHPHQHHQQRSPIHIDPLLAPIRVAMSGTTPPSISPAATYQHHNNSSLSTQPAQYSGPVTPDTSPHPVSGSPSPQPGTSYQPTSTNRSGSHHLPHHHSHPSHQQLHAHSPKALCGVGLLPLVRKSSSFSFSGGGGIGLGSSSGGSSLRDGLPLCEQDDACPEINNPIHQQQFAHSCRLYPCYHGHIRRHAKLFRHVPGQVIKMPNSSFDDRSMSSAGSNVGGRSNNGGGGSVCGSLQKSRASNKASRLALSSVAYSSISADSPNAYRITVKNGDTAYDIHGDWMNVKVHTFKRYLHQVFGVEAKYQTLALERWVQKSSTSSNNNPHKRAATPDGGDTAGVTNSSDEEDLMSGSTTTTTSSSLSSSGIKKTSSNNNNTTTNNASDSTATTSQQNTTELGDANTTPAQPQQLHRKLVKMDDDLGKVGAFGVVEGSVVVLLLDRGHQSNNNAAPQNNTSRPEEDPALKAALRDERKRAVIGDL